LAIVLHSRCWTSQQDLELQNINYTVAYLNDVAGHVYPNH